MKIRLQHRQIDYQIEGETQPADERPGAAGRRRRPDGRAALERGRLPRRALSDRRRKRGPARRSGRPGAGRPAGRRRRRSPRLAGGAVPPGSGRGSGAALGGGRPHQGIPAGRAARAPGAARSPRRGAVRPAGAGPQPAHRLPGLPPAPGPPPAAPTTTPCTATCGSTTCATA